VVTDYLIDLWYVKTKTDANMSEFFEIESIAEDGEDDISCRQEPTWILQRCQHVVSSMMLLSICMHIAFNGVELAAVLYHRACGARRHGPMDDARAVGESQVGLELGAIA